MNKNLFVEIILIKTDKSHINSLNKSYIESLQYLIFALMNKFIVYSKDSVSLDEALNHINEASNSNDELVIFFHLSELSKEVIPLIGDLKEIRADKYTRLLIEWYNREQLNFSKFTPIILQGEFDKNTIKNHLNKSKNTKILILSPLLGKIKGVFRDLEKSLDFNLIEVSSNNESSAEACE